MRRKKMLKEALDIYFKANGYDGEVKHGYLFSDRGKTYLFDDFCVEDDVLVARNFDRIHPETLEISFTTKSITVKEIDEKFDLLELN